MCVPHAFPNKHFHVSGNIRQCIIIASHIKDKHQHFNTCFITYHIMSFPYAPPATGGRALLVFSWTSSGGFRGVVKSSLCCTTWEFQWEKGPELSGVLLDPRQFNSLVSRAKPTPSHTPANARTSPVVPTLKPSYSQVTKLGIRARDPGKQHVIGAHDQPRDLQVLWGSRDPRARDPVKKTGDPIRDWSAT